MAAVPEATDAFLLAGHLASMLTRSASCDNDTSSSSGDERDRAADEADAARAMSLLAQPKAVDGPRHCRKPFPGTRDARSDLAGDRRLVDLRIRDALPPALAHAVPPDILARVVADVRPYVSPSLQSKLDDETGLVAASNALTGLAALCIHAARPFCTASGLGPASGAASAAPASSVSATAAFANPFITTATATRTTRAARTTTTTGTQPRYPFLVSDVAAEGRVQVSELLDRLCLVVQGKEEVKGEGEPGLTAPLYALVDTYTRCHRAAQVLRQAAARLPSALGAAQVRAAWALYLASAPRSTLQAAQSPSRALALAPACAVLFLRTPEDAPCALGTLLARAQADLAPRCCALADALQGTGATLSTITEEFSATVAVFLAGLGKEALDRVHASLGDAACTLLAHARPHMLLDETLFVADSPACRQPLARFVLKWMQEAGARLRAAPVPALVLPRAERPAPPRPPGVSLVAQQKGEEEGAAAAGAALAHQPSVIRDWVAVMFPHSDRPLGTALARWMESQGLGDFAARIAATVSQSLKETQLPPALADPQILGYCKSMFFYLLEQLVFQELRTGANPGQGQGAAGSHAAAGGGAPVSPQGTAPASPLPAPDKTALESFISLFKSEAFLQTLLAVSVEFVVAVFEPNKESRLEWAVTVFQVDPMHIFRIVGNITQLADKTSRPAEFEQLFVSFQREVLEDWLWRSGINNPFLGHIESASSQYTRYLASRIAPLNQRLFSSDLARQCAIDGPVLKEQVSGSRQRITQTALRYIFLYAAKTLEKMATALKATQTLAEQMWNLFVFVTSEHAPLLFNHKLQQILFCTALSVLQENGAPVQIPDAIRNYVAITNNKVPRKVLQFVALTPEKDVSMESFFKDAFMPRVSVFLKGLPGFFNTKACAPHCMNGPCNSAAAAATTVCAKPVNHSVSSNTPQPQTLKTNTSDMGNIHTNQAMKRACPEHTLSDKAIGTRPASHISPEHQRRRTTSVGSTNLCTEASKEQFILAGSGSTEMADDNQRTDGTGNTNAMLNLGFCYMNGDGVPQDKKKAIELYQKASDMGNTNAMFKLALCYEKGDGVSQDKKKAIELFERAADMGHTNAMVKVGLCYEKGEGVSQDKQKAIELYQRAADMGNTNAMVNLGFCYDKGDGVSQDTDKAIELYQKAADMGNTNAMFKLGFCYENGNGVSQDKKKAIELFQRAADMGDTNAMVNLGVCYMNVDGVSQDKKKAIKLYQKAADMGNTNAMFKLGFCYEKGDGVSQDQKKAIELYLRSAENGNINAMNTVGECYFKGGYVTRDFKKAFEWFLKSAEKGNANAMNSVGICYEKGKGVEQDMEKAFKWFLKSANNGNAFAMNSVGLCYGHGQGVTQDKKAAFEWFLKSAENGNADAMRQVGQCTYNAFSNLRKRAENGQIVALNPTELFKWYLKLANNGDHNAAFYAGLCYSEGRGIEQDKKRAIDFFERAMEMGSIDAMIQLAICHANADGVEQNMKKSSELFEVVLSVFKKCL